MSLEFFEFKFLSKFNVSVGSVSLIKKECLLGFLSNPDIGCLFLSCPLEEF